MCPVFQAAVEVAASVAAKVCKSVEHVGLCMSDEALEELAMEVAELIHDGVHVRLEESYAKERAKERDVRKPS